MASNAFPVKQEPGLSPGAAKLNQMLQQQRVAAANATPAQQRVSGIPPLDFDPGVDSMRQQQNAPSASVPIPQQTQFGQGFPQMQQSTSGAQTPLALPMPRQQQQAFYGQPTSTYAYPDRAYIPDQRGEAFMYDPIKQEQVKREQRQSGAVRSPTAAELIDLSGSDLPMHPGPAVQLPSVFPQASQSQQGYSTAVTRSGFGFSDTPNVNRWFDNPSQPLASAYDQFDRKYSAAMGNLADAAVALVRTAGAESERDAFAHLSEAQKEELQRTWANLDEMGNRVKDSERALVTTQNQLMNRDFQTSRLTADNSVMAGTITEQQNQIVRLAADRDQAAIDSKEKSIALLDALTAKQLAERGELRLMDMLQMQNQFIAKLRGERSSLEHQKALDDSAIHDLQTQLTSKQTQLEQLKIAANQASTTEVALNTANMTAEQLRKRINLLEAVKKQMNTEYTEEASRLRVEIGKLTNQLKQQKAALDAEISKNDTKQSKENALEAKLAEQIRKVSELEKEKSDLASALATTQNENQQLAADNLTLKADKKELETKVVSLEAANNAVLEKYAKEEDAKQDAVRLKMELATAQTELNTLKKAREDAKKKEEDVMKAADDLKKAVAEQAKIANAEADKARLDANTANTQLSAVKLALDSQTQRAAELEARLQSQETQLISLSEKDKQVTVFRDLYLGSSAMDDSDKQIVLYDGGDNVAYDDSKSDSKDDESSAAPKSHYASMQSLRAQDVPQRWLLHKQKLALYALSVPAYRMATFVSVEKDLIWARAVELTLGELYNPLMPLRYQLATASLEASSLLTVFANIVHSLYTHFLRKSSVLQPGLSRKDAERAEAGQNFVDIIRNEIEANPEFNQFSGLYFQFLANLRESWKSFREYGTRYAVVQQQLANKEQPDDAGFWHINDPILRSKLIALFPDVGKQLKGYANLTNESPILYTLVFGRAIRRLCGLRWRYDLSPADNFFLNDGGHRREFPNRYGYTPTLFMSSLIAERLRGPGGLVSRPAEKITGQWKDIFKELGLHNSLER